MTLLWALVLGLNVCTSPLGGGTRARADRRELRLG